MTWYKQNVKVITPLNIGDGTEYSPIEYSVDNNYVYVYDISKGIDSYSKVKKLKNIIISKTDKRNKNRICLYADEIIKELKIKLDPIEKIKLKTNLKGKYVNIRNFIKDNKGNRYVPGSTIKGFLRTIILWNTLRKKSPQWIKNNLNNIEEKIFGNPTEDPLKCLLISDSEQIPNEKFSVYVFFRYKKRNPHIKAKGIPVNVICLDPNTEFTFYIKLNRNYKEFKKFCELVDLDPSASDEEIIGKLKELCSEFVGRNSYDSNMVLGFGTGYEYKSIKNILLNPNLFDNLTIAEIEKNYKKSKIRFVMKNNLKLKIKYKDYPTTVWIVNNVRPGFCKWL